MRLGIDKLVWGSCENCKLYGWAWKIARLWKVKNSPHHRQASKRRQICERTNAGATSEICPLACPPPHAPFSTPPTFGLGEIARLCVQAPVLPSSVASQPCKAQFEDKQPHETIPDCTIRSHLFEPSTKLRSWLHKTWDQLLFQFVSSGPLFSCNMQHIQCDNGPSETNDGWPPFGPLQMSIHQV